MIALLVFFNWGLDCSVIRDEPYLASFEVDNGTIKVIETWQVNVFGPAPVVESAEFVSDTSIQVFMAVV